MSWVSIAFTVCIGAWLFPLSPLPIDYMLSDYVVSQTTKLSTKNLSTLKLAGLQPVQEQTRDRLNQIARSITVRIIAGRNEGSGVLIQRQGTLYTVVTNRHVVAAAASYQLQTPDSRVYPATLLKKVNFHGNDLAILQFRSTATYEIALLGRAQTLAIGTPLVSAGFPIDPIPTAKRGFALTIGTLSLVPEKPFVGGYQLGYTNAICQGMSGGPVLDRQGKLVGLNSLHAYPLWGDPYIFQDGSRPTAELRSRMAQSSWAIPIETVVCLTATKISLQFAQQQPETCAPTGTQKQS